METKIVHVQGGILIQDLNEQLAAAPYHLALPTQGAQPYVSLVGALSTCTKGTGIDVQCLSSYIEEFTIVLPNGYSEIYNKEKNADLFQNILCGMGCFGMITSLKIQCVDLEQWKETTESISMSYLLNNFTDITHSAPRIRMWWSPFDGQVCISRITSTSLPQSASQTHSWFRRRLIGYYLQQFLLYLCVWFPSFTPYVTCFLYSATYSIPQQKIGTQSEILTLECLFRRRTSEWSIPFEQATNVLKELNTLFIQEQLYEMNGVFEIRFLKSDRFPLSPSFSLNENQIFVDIGLIQYCPYGTTELHLPFQRILSRFCMTCRRYGGRFHWAKEISADIQNLDDIKQIWGNENGRIDQWLKARNHLDLYNEFWNKRLRTLLSNEVVR